MTETTHTLIEDAANLVREHGCKITAADLLECKRRVPNVPLAPRSTGSSIGEQQILDAIDAMGVPELSKLLAALKEKYGV